jgi:hypothetical protein
VSRDRREGARDRVALGADHVGDEGDIRVGEVMPGAVLVPEVDALEEVVHPAVGSAPSVIGPFRESARVGSQVEQGGGRPSRQLPRSRQS